MTLKQLIDYTDQRLEYNSMQMKKMKEWRDSAKTDTEQSTYTAAHNEFATAYSVYKEYKSLLENLCLD